MRSFVISLKRTPERLAAFNSVNDHRAFEVCEAVDGATIDRKTMIDAGIIDVTLPYTHGALGNALSHLGLWKQCSAGAEAYTICEDDALLHRSFDQYADSILRKLPDDWDLIFWGWNFDSLLSARFPATGMPLVMFFEQDAMRAESQKYLSSPVEPGVLKLRHAFGTACYSITPKGAKNLLQRLLPLRDSYVVVKAINRTMRTTTLDIAMNSALDSMNCFACFPPIALTHNDRAASTVVTG